MLDNRNNVQQRQRRLAERDRVRLKLLAYDPAPDGASAFCPSGVIPRASVRGRFPAAARRHVGANGYDPLTIDQARALAAQVIEAADEIDRWANT